MSSRKKLYPAAIIALMLAAGFGGVGAAFLTFGLSGAEQNFLQAAQNSNEDINACFSNSVTSPSSEEKSSTSPNPAENSQSAASASKKNPINGTSELAFLSESDIEKLNSAVWELLISKGYSTDECLWVRMIEGQDYPFYVTTSNNRFIEVDESENGFSVKTCSKPKALVEEDNIAVKRYSENNHPMVLAYHVNKLKGRLPENCATKLSAATENYYLSQGEAIKPSSLTVNTGSIKTTDSLTEFTAGCFLADGKTPAYAWVKYNNDDGTFSFDPL